MNKLITKRDIQQYKKNGDWNKNLYLDAVLNPQSNKYIHDKIIKDANFYQTLAKTINEKFLHKLVLDEVSAETLGLDPNKYQIVYTNFIGHYMLEIRRLSDRMIINFKQASPQSAFFFYYTKGNRSDISLLKRLIK